MRHGPLVLGALMLVLRAPPLLAGTCATQHVPAATLLVPYFFVSRNGSQGGDIPEGGADTLLSITNTGSLGVIVQATVWSKYGRPLLAWSIPFHGHDVAFFRMKDVLNGKLNVNRLDRAEREPRSLAEPDGVRSNPSAQQEPDPCGLASGFDPDHFTRFANPDPEDAARSQSVYAVPAFSGMSRFRLWDSLDESGDVRSFTSAGGTNILDEDNPYCGVASDGRLDGDFSGYVTFDVMNTCTNRYPDDGFRYTSGVLATGGWEEHGASPNVLMGDVFLVDSRSAGGHVSGDSMVSLPFDPALSASSAPSFHGRYARHAPEAPFKAPDAFLFEGDGRMPLGTRYVLRYLSDSRQGLSTRLVVWRSGVTPTASGPPQPDLCAWWRDCVAGRPRGGWGYSAPDQRLLTFSTFDNDENRFVAGGGGGGFPVYLHAYLQTQHLDLLDNGDFNPGGFKGGVVHVELPGDPLTNQAYVSARHTAPGLSMSVGHAATVTRSPVSCGVSQP